MSSVQCLREFVHERLTAAAEEILGVFLKTIIDYEEEIDRQRKLLDGFVLKPETKLHKKKKSHLSLCNEGVLADQQLWSSPDQEERDPLQIKEEHEDLCTNQEGEPHVLKEDTNVFQRRGRGRSEDQTLFSDAPPLTNVSVRVVKSESDREDSDVSDQHLSPSSHRAKSQDQRENSSTDQEIFKCLICNDEFQDLVNLKNHIRTHTGEKHFKCDTCGKVFTQKALLVKHMMTHTGGKPFRCRVCGKEFSCQSNHVTHMKTHTGEKPHACITCGKGFSRGADLRRHNRTHTGEKPYSCIHCGKEFPYHSSLTNHVRVHTGEKPYKCIWCGKGFAVRTTLKIHTRVHTGEKPYKCNICDRNFAHNTGLRLHRRIHAPETQ